MGDFPSHYEPPFSKPSQAMPVYNSPLGDGKPPSYLYGSAPDHGNGKYYEDEKNPGA
jgi:hypothetical protein